MKPKDLKFPFTWDERRPLLEGRVLFVPRYYDRHEEWRFPGWEELFGNHAKVSIEYCAGNGAWILEKALQNPDQNWVAVERRFDRVRKIWAKIQNHKLSNLFVVGGEALTFSRFYLPAHTVDEVFVNFPDPWPKERHAKHRLIQDPFASELARILKPSGKANFVTDDFPYAQQMITVMNDHPSWTPCLPDPFYVTDWPLFGSSYFDALWRQKGRTIHHMQFRHGKPHAR